MLMSYEVDVRKYNEGLTFPKKCLYRPFRAFLSYILPVHLVLSTGKFPLFDFIRRGMHKQGIPFIFDLCGIIE